MSCSVLHCFFFFRFSLSFLAFPIAFLLFSRCFFTFRYLHDILYISWAVLVLSCFTDYAWYLLLTVRRSGFDILEEMAVLICLVCVLLAGARLCGVPGLGWAHLAVPELTASHAGCGGGGRGQG